jgi:hypothetical protein
MREKRLNQAVLGGMLVLSVLAGCNSGTLVPPGSSSRGDGYATFVWNIFDIEKGTADPALALTCGEVGAGSVVVTLSDLDGYPVSQDVFPCTGGNVVSTSRVPTGSYYVSFDLYGDGAVYGNTTTSLDSFTLADYGTNDYTAFRIVAGANDFTFDYAPFIAQRFTVSWGIYSQGAATTCAATGANSVRLDFVTLDPVAGGSTATISSVFPCTSGLGQSFAIPLGPTRVQWSLALVAGPGQDLQAIPGGPVSVPADRNINLGPQSFRF